MQSFNLWLKPLQFTFSLWGTELLVILMKLFHLYVPMSNNISFNLKTIAVVTNLANLMTILYVPPRCKLTNYFLFFPNEIHLLQKDNSNNVNLLIDFSVLVDSL